MCFLQDAASELLKNAVTAKFAFWAFSEVRIAPVQRLYDVGQFPAKRLSSLRRGEDTR